MTHDGRDKPAEITLPEGVTESQLVAELRATPFLRHGMISNSLAATTVKADGLAASAHDVGEVLRHTAEKIGSGNLQPITDMLLSQSVMLDVTATQLMGRAWENVGKYPGAFHRYMNLALKTQAQSRTALEALARMHQPREQVVRHVHVYEGGQAVVAEQLHINGPGPQNAGSTDQSQAAGTARSGERAALPSPDPLGNSLPIAGRSRKAEMQDARRDQPRRAPRKQQRPKARASDG